MSACKLPVFHRQLLGVLFAGAGKLNVVGLLARIRQSVGLLVEDFKEFRVGVNCCERFKVFRLAVELPVAAAALEVAKLRALPQYGLNVPYVQLETAGQLLFGNELCTWLGNEIAEDAK